MTFARIIVFFHLLIAMGLVACKEQKNPVNEIPVIEPSAVLPVLSGFPETYMVIDTSGQLESIYFPIILSDAELISFDSIEKRRSHTFLSDSVKYSLSNDLSLIIDPTQSFSGKFHERVPFDYYLRHLDEHGNEIPHPKYVPPYDSIVRYPVFLINTTDSIQLIENQDGKIVCVQEARMRNGEWKAIEHFEYSGCGNSYGTYALDPDEYLLFGANKYTGNFETQMRVRLKTNGRILLSNEFSGRINEQQFEEAPLGGFSWNRYLRE